jgi:serine/threonine-protein kinase RsbW
MLVTKKIQIPNKLSCLHHVRRGARIFLYNHVNEKWQFRLVLALDEAISNIIEHGFPTPKKSKIELELIRTENGFTFIITDSAVHFNPLERIKNHQEHSSKMKTEGFGLLLLSSILKISYKKGENQENILILEKSFSEMI